MTVALDAFSNPTPAGTTLSWTHTPVGTPRGIIVQVVQNVTGDEVTTVTYGGVAMAEVVGSPNTKATPEDGTVYTYFLGSSIPTGAQTVEVNVTATGSTKAAGCISVTAAGDTQVQDTDVTINSDSATNPSATLALGGVSCFCAEAFFSGIAVVGNVTPFANWTSQQEFDFTNQVAGFYTYDIIGTTNVTMGWTQSAEDALAIGIAVTESAVVPPSPSYSSYSDLVKGTFGSSLLAYWPLWESSGVTAYDISGNVRDGVNTGVTLAQSGIGDGHTAASYNGTTSNTNVYSTSLRDAFNGAAGTLTGWAKVSGAGVWTDATTRRAATFGFDTSTNYVLFGRTSTANQLSLVYNAGSVVKTVATTAFGGSLSWIHFCLTWDKAADEVKGYINGSQVGATLTGLGTWAGLLGASRCNIGSLTNVPAQIWSGSIAHVALGNQALTAAEVAALVEIPGDTATTVSLPRLSRSISGGEPNHELWLTTDTGVRIAQLTTGTTLTASRVVNGIGWFAMQMPLSFDINLIRLDRMIQLWRQPSGGAMSLWNVYLLRKWKFATEGSREVVTLEGPDKNDLLRRRIVAAFSGTEQATKTDFADDMMKEVVTQSIADGVAPVPTAGTRVWSNLSIQADAGAGPTITKSFPFDKLLSGSGSGVLAVLAKAAREAGTEVFFDIVPNVITGSSITFQFRTTINQPGQDVTGRVVFDQARGNMKDPVLEYDYSEEENYIYAAGQGEGAARNIQQVYDSDRYNASIWARSEGFADARNQTADNGVREAGRAQLEEGRPRIRASATPVDTAGTRFGIDWNFGDKVRWRYKNVEFDTIIRAVTLAVANKKETVQARLDFEGLVT